MVQIHQPENWPPALLQKVLNFSKASAGHVMKGLPKASDEQVAERFAICLANQCGYYVGNEEQGVCNHSSCGCTLKAVGKEGLNKLRWADQKCPVGHWGPVEPIQEDQKDET